MGTVPGQMAKMGKTAKKEANKKWKEGSRCGGGVARHSPQSCLEQEVRLGVRETESKEAAGAPEKQRHWDFISPGRRGTWRPTLAP